MAADRRMRQWAWRGRQLTAEFHAIAQLQHRLLPREVPQLPGWSLAVHYSVGHWPGGDYYDFLLLPDGRLGVLIADASGHGGQSAVMMAIARTVLHTCPLSCGQERAPFCPLVGWATRPPHVTLAHLNNVLGENSLPDQFMTAFLGLLDPRTGRLDYACAGHPPPRWWQAATNTVAAPPDVGGLPLAVLPGTTYEPGEMTLAPGDLLVLYTDGLTEAQNRAGELFGFARLDAAVIESAGRSAPGVQDVLLARLGEFLPPGRRPQDDLTLVILGRDPVEAPSEERRYPLIRVPDRSS